MRKYTYNLDVLNEWSSGLAYILGLALTDGSIHKDKTRVAFYSSDLQMLEIVQQFFESTSPLVTHSTPGKYSFEKGGTSYPGKKQMYVFYLNSKAAAERFIQLGITPNKSYVGPYPSIPQEVWWHFFRGVFDGDGNIYFSKKHGLRITIAGNRNCILGIQTDLNRLFAIPSTARYLDMDKVKLLDLCGESAEQALSYLYQDSENLRLERKYNQWRDWNENYKLVRPCILCDTPIRSPKSQKLCPSCSAIRDRLMNRRSDHFRRNGVWYTLRSLCKPEESHLHIENLDRNSR
jgi:hypothetical protein